MSGFLHTLLDQPAWVVLLVTGTLVFVEDALFVGFVIPGETAAILAGVAAKLGHVPLWAVLLTVAAAAVVGDSVGYEVGRLAGPRLLRWHRLDPHRRRLDDAQSLLARRGGTAVFLGRWVAFFRATMPALAGIARMPYRTFLPWNAVGGIAWTAAAVGGGYAAGASYTTVERVLGRGTAVVVLVLVLVAVVVWRVRSHRAEARYEQAG